MMIVTRHETIGIKQVINLDWMQKTTNLLLAGLDAKTIRQELHEFLAERKGNGSGGQGSTQNRDFAVTNLMKIWVHPDPELISFRDASLTFLLKNQPMSLIVHWGMISVAYPFWFNVARQTGRLLALQDQVTQVQITTRMKEQYGDRQTISRNTRYVIRSFVAWGVLKDSEGKGCYEKVTPAIVDDADLAILMFESALHATASGKGTMGQLLCNPSFFPFQLPAISGDLVSHRSESIDVVRYGLDDELLKLKNK